MPRKRLALMSVALTAVIAFAPAAADQAAPVDAGDDAIRRGVERALSDLEDTGGIRVRVEGGVVWLTGSVPVWQGNASRLYATRSVTGVRSIMNELQIVAPNEKIR